MNCYVSALWLLWGGEENVLQRLTARSVLLCKPPKHAARLGSRGEGAARPSLCWCWVQLVVRPPQQGGAGACGRTGEADGRCCWAQCLGQSPCSFLLMIVGSEAEALPEHPHGTTGLLVQVVQEGHWKMGLKCLLLVPLASGKMTISGLTQSWMMCVGGKVGVKLMIQI